MDQVNNIELNDPDIYPDNEVLKPILGKGFDSYIELIEMINEMAMEPEWRYYKDGKSWLCKVQYKKKTIIWMSAWKNYIKATIYFAEKFTEMLMGSELSAETKNKLKDIKKVGKSIPLSFDICSKKAIRELKIAAKLKIVLK